jgi:hypothetical protein
MKKSWTFYLLNLNHKVTEDSVKKQSKEILKLLAEGYEIYHAAPINNGIVYILKK